MYRGNGLRTTKAQEHCEYNKNIEVTLGYSRNRINKERAIGEMS